MNGRLPVQPMAITEHCPVCRARGLVRARAMEDGSKVCVACPHCTDPMKLLMWLETFRDVPQTSQESA